MTQCTATFRKTVMISGHWDPFHFAHLDYIKQAAPMGDLLVCVIASDNQAIMKKGKVNEPEADRAELLHLILKGLDISHVIHINHWDKGTILVAEALALLCPNIFCRGSDKSPKDMPLAERTVCDELGIQIVYTKGKQAHGSEFV